MLGFDALGKLALGQLPSVGLPFNSTLPVAPSRPVVSAAAAVLGSSMMLLVTVPFVQSNWAQAKSIRPAAVDQVAYNSKLYTNDVPFRSTTEFRGSINVRLATPPDQLHTNIARFTNPIPFGPYDWSKPAGMAPVAPQPPQNRIHLSAVVVAAPFAQSDWSTPRRISNLPAPDRPYNALIYSGVPFSQADWSVQRRVSDFLPPDRSYNVLIYSEVPLGRADWSKGQPVGASSAWLPGFNSNLYGVAAPAPFVAVDWSKPFAIRSAPVTPAPLNLSLSIVVQNTFYQTDWSITVRSKTAAADQTARNVLVLSEVPFFLTDWPKAFDLAGLPPGSGPLNVNLFSNPIPFAQYDWSKPKQSPNWQGAKSADFNLSLASAPVAPPFYQLDWSKPVNVTPVRPDQPPPNITLLVTPPPPSPFYQLDWSKPYNVAGLPSQPAPYNINLYPSIEPPAELPPVAPENTGAGDKAGRKTTATSIRRAVYIDVFTHLERERRAEERRAALQTTTALQSVAVRKPEIPAEPIGRLSSLTETSAGLIKQAARSVAFEAFELKRKQDDEAVALLLLSY